MTNMDNRHSHLLSGFISCVFLLITSTAGAAEEPAAAEKPALPVIVTAVKQQADFTDMVEALGTTKANETVDITANVSEKVEAVHFQDGQKVSKGQLLLTLERNEETAELKSAQALLDERKAAFKRAQVLEKQKALSIATLEESLALMHQAEGEIEAIQSRISDRVIKAPFAGVLGLRNVSPGTLVRPGDVITTIHDLSQIKVDFEVPSIFLRELRPGLPIEGRVQAFAGEVFSGSISTVDTQVNAVTRTVTVRAVLPNKDEVLKPGLLMSITLFKNPRQALLIPEEALLQRQKKFFVYRAEQLDGKTVASETEVSIGSRVPGKVEILSGIKKGELIIVHGLMQVRPGQSISIRAVDESGETLEQLLQQTPVAGEAGQ